mmetsp:Transcript_2063/g.4491  ORF Transcript_2063/g.4491 Transcript_2063/m.4491 type:complete len:343 (-) Transcript_2063:115-1143(-)
MKLTSNMRFTILCLAASTVSATYEGFFGKPTSHVESNEKTRRLEYQLRKNLGESKPITGPRGVEVEPKEETAEGDSERNLAYYGYYEHSPYYYEEPQYDHYYYEDPYYEYQYPKKQTVPYQKYPKYYYPSMSKKSKKTKSMKWGGKMSGSMKWKGKWQKKYPNRPVYPKKTETLDMVFQDDTVFTDDVLEDEDCELFVAAEAFSFGGYTANVTVEGATGIGTQYIWEPAYMQDRYSEDLIDAVFSGYCILTSSLSGYCHFVIVNNSGDQITMSGTLTTPTSSTSPAGTIAITGGTGSMAGVIGEAEVFANPIGTNVFELATRFDVDVVLGVIVCKPQALPVY